MFGVNLILAAAWLALTGELTLPNTIVGLILGYSALWLMHKAQGDESPTSSYIHRVPRIFRFIGTFIRTILQSNLTMAKAVISPLDQLKPAIVGIPLDITHPRAITLLANWITLTPGTLSLEVSEDQKTLFVHTFDVGESVETFRQQIKNDFERRVMEVMQ